MASIADLVLYEASVPVFRRYLAQLGGMIELASASHLPPAVLLEARLAPDMLPFRTQVHIAANFALRTCFPLSGQAVPPYGEFPATFDGLRANLAYVDGMLNTLQVQQFESAATRLVQDGAGGAVVSLRGPDFLFQYAVPNFFFHVTTAYAILRAQGVQLGKEHFDGFHYYKND